MGDNQIRMKQKLAGHSLSTITHTMRVIVWNSNGTSQQLTYSAPSSFSLYSCDSLHRPHRLCACDTCTCMFSTKKRNNQIFDLNSKRATNEKKPFNFAKNVPLRLWTITLRNFFENNFIFKFNKNNNFPSWNIIRMKFGQKIIAKPASRIYEEEEKKNSNWPPPPPLLAVDFFIFCLFVWA